MAASDPYAGLDPALADAVKKLIAAAKGRVYVVSGKRSREEQAALYADRANNPYPVGRPGLSRHETGQAVDLGGDLPLARQIAQQFGLGQPVANDPIHFELLSGRGTMAQSAAGGRYPGWVDRFVVWKDAGGPATGEGIPLGSFAAAVSKAENGSGGASVISKPNNNGSVDIGLWQINSSHIGKKFTGPDGKPFTIQSQQWLQDPANNARAAYALSGGGRDWHAWCTAYSDNACGTKGGTYLGRGSKAVEQYNNAEGAVTSGGGILGLLTLGAGGPGSTELQPGNPQPGAPDALRTMCDTGVDVWKVGPWTVLNQCQAQSFGGSLLMVAGGTVMLVGTIVILFRFQGTKGAATAAAAAVPGVGPAVSLVAGRGSGPGPSRRRTERADAERQQRREDTEALRPQRAYDIAKARERGRQAGQVRDRGRAPANDEAFK